MCVREYVCVCVYWGVGGGSATEGKATSCNYVRPGRAVMTFQPRRVVRGITTTLSHTTGTRVLGLQYFIGETDQLERPCII